MPEGLSIIEASLQRRAARHRAVLLPRVIAALDAMAAAGIEAWVVGSVARDRITPYSDADFLIAGPRETIYRAFDIIEAHLQDEPFDIVPRDALDPITRAAFQSRAVDASGLRERSSRA